MKKLLALSFSLLLLAGCEQGTNPVGYNSENGIGSAAGVDAYELVDLGTLPSGTVSYALDINNLGQIVGYTNTSTSSEIAVIWDASGTIHELDPSHTYTRSYAGSINNLGQSTGFVAVSLSPFLRSAYKYDPDDGMILLQSTNPSYNQSFGGGINDQGHVAGGFYSKTLGYKAALWMAPDQVIELDMPPGASQSNSIDINNSDHVVGWMRLPSKTIPFLWTGPGNVQGLPLIPGGDFAVANSINETGQIVGQSSTIDIGYGDPHAVIWNSPDQVLDLGTLPGDITSDAKDINDLGQVVGLSYLSGVGDYRAFLWTEDEGMAELPGLGGATIAQAINNNGWIVGHSQTPEGLYHAVLWKTELELEVEIDIKPGSDENPINLKSKGKIPVAILTTPDLDAADIDVSTITLGNDDGDDTPVATKKKGGFMASLEDIDSDGDLDRVLHFEAQMLVENGDLDSETTELVLKGMTTDGTQVRGVDNVRIVP